MYKIWTDFSSFININFIYRTLTPLLFGELLRFWSVDSDMTRETAAIYAVCMLLANWVAAFSIHQGHLYCQQFGMKLRTATSSLMFRKVTTFFITYGSRNRI